MIIKLIIIKRLSNIKLIIIKRKRLAVHGTYARASEAPLEPLKLLLLVSNETRSKRPSLVSFETKEARKINNNYEEVNTYEEVD